MALNFKVNQMKQNILFVFLLFIAISCGENGGVAPLLTSSCSIPSNGEVQTTLGFTGLNLPYGVAVDSSGSVYVVDYSNNRVKKLTSNYVVDYSNNRVKKLTSNGVESVLGFTGLNGASEVAVDSSGSVYVTDYNNNRVKKLTSNGVESVLGFTGLSGPIGVAVDSSGSVYVSEFNNDRVKKLTSNGVESVLGFTGLSVKKLTSNGVESVLGFTGLSLSRGVAVDCIGNVYVSSTGNNLVEKL